MSVCSIHHDSTRSVPPPVCLKACRLVISKACIEVAKCKPWNCRFWHVRPASHSAVQKSSNHRSGLPKTAFPRCVFFRVRPRNCLPDHWLLVGRSPLRAFQSRYVPTKLHTVVVPQCAGGCKRRAWAAGIESGWPCHHHGAIVVTPTRIVWLRTAPRPNNGRSR
jgi:hypothetical protein